MIGNSVFEAQLARDELSAIIERDRRQRIGAFALGPELIPEEQCAHGLNLLLPTDAAARKGVPIATGVFDYFPAALAEIAKVSKAGNEQHHPGEPLHWERGKSMDQADTLLRHFMERGTVDADGLRHSAKMAWRALALLQLELEAAGAPVARNAR